MVAENLQVAAISLWLSAAVAAAAACAAAGATAVQAAAAAMGSVTTAAAAAGCKDLLQELSIPTAEGLMASLSYQSSSYSSFAAIPVPIMTPI